MKKFHSIPALEDMKNKDGTPLFHTQNKRENESETPHPEEISDLPIYSKDEQERQACVTYPNSTLMSDENEQDYRDLLPPEVNHSIDTFQSTIQEKTLATTAIASVVNYAFRRSYLEEPYVTKVKGFDYANYKQNPISWLKLKTVGIQTNFGIKESSLALEYILHSLYAPGKYRFLFLVSSDTIETTIRLGIQSLSNQVNEHDNHKDKEVIEAINHYAGNVWAGLCFEEDHDFKSPIQEMIEHDKTKTTSQGNEYVCYRNTRMRAFSGIPAFRLRDNKTNETGLNNSIDKLSEALRGKKWTYLIICDPIASSEVSRYQTICRDFTGRMESLKKLSVSEGISQSMTRTMGENSSEQHGSSHSDPSDPIKNLTGDNSGKNILTTIAMGLISPYLLAFSPLVRGSTNSENHGTSIGRSSSESTSNSQSNNISKDIINKHAEAIAKLLEDQVDRYQKCESLGAWAVGAYLVGEDETTAEVGANVIRSLTSGDNSHFEPIRAHSLLPENGLFPTMKDPISALMRYMSPKTYFECNGFPIRHPLGKQFDEMKMIINTRELTQLVNIPLNNIPGIPVRKISPDTGLCKTSVQNGLNIGSQMFRGRIIDSMPYCIAQNTLAKHTLVAGINGSGKTNTILGILNALIAVKTPFLVIEPAKQEYVQWALEKNRGLLKKHNGDKARAKHDQEWINVYIPGREKWGDMPLEKLELNPFDFVWLNTQEPPKIAEHIDRLKTVINAALPMYEILPVLMEELIYSAYAMKHAPTGNTPGYPTWLPNYPNERYPEFSESVHIPSFQGLRVLIPKLFEKRKYAQDIARNLRAALETRIDSFKRGWRKDLLNKDNPRKTREDWNELFTRPSVINLTSLTSDEDKAFFMSIILLFIYEFNQEKSELTTQTSIANLSHLLVIEEAHRILGRCETSASYSAAPKQKVSEMFSNMISEVRAYGQGIMIADQIPCRLNEDAIKNTNLKIVHKLVSADDRLAMATALNLQDEQSRIIGDLEVGEVLVRGDMDKETYMVKINKNK